MSYGNASSHWQCRKNEKQVLCLRRRMTISQWVCGWRVAARLLVDEVGGATVFAEDVAHAADLGSYAAELVFEVLVAAVEVVDAVEDGLAVGDQGGEDERGGGAEVGAHDGG